MSSAVMKFVLESHVNVIGFTCDYGHHFQNLECCRYTNLLLSRVIRVLRLVKSDWKRSGTCIPTMTFIYIIKTGNPIYTYL